MGLTDADIAVLDIFEGDVSTILFPISPYGQLNKRSGIFKRKNRGTSTGRFSGYHRSCCG